MKNLIFSNHLSTTRKDLVEFSSNYLEMKDKIKEKILANKKIPLLLGRIIDSGFDLSPEIIFFNASYTTSYNGDIIEAQYYGDMVGYHNEKLLVSKKIRMDNPLDEIPILPGYEKSTFFNFGENLTSYLNFITEARKFLKSEVNNFVNLYYQNDGGNQSVINCLIKEVNKSNILAEDYYETQIIDLKTQTSMPFFRRRKNHRFISGNGYLFFVGTADQRVVQHDDGLVFGEEKTWSFK